MAAAAGLAQHLKAKAPSSGAPQDVSPNWRHSKTRLTLVNKVNNTG
jgi:hypothetical protein